MQLRKLSNGLKASYRGSDVNRRVDRFDQWMERAQVEDAGPNTYDHAETVREYYDLCSDFMIFGWSESLHFAPLSTQESLEESQIRHQRLMIEKLDLHEGNDGDRCGLRDRRTDAPRSPGGWCQSSRYQ